ncbi:hypothetical protein ABVF61_26855 [Roseibium sp. HPY-6]|uniref:hypothetical protein n=1 Tax=Roseibium sp. HPY-6 TaxID=3229852 RepID=UPI00338E2F21
MPYEELDSDTRCFTLVGQFLWHWAYLEASINDAIATALELGHPQRYIVTKNIQFRDKIKTLKASVAVASSLSDEERRMHKRTLNKISDYAAKRNIIAHDMFGPDDDTDSVMFLRTVASDRFELPVDLWSTDDFVAAFTDLDNFRDQVTALEESLKTANNFKRIAQALVGKETGIEALFSYDSMDAPDFPVEPNSDRDPDP